MSDQQTTTLPTWVLGIVLAAVVSAAGTGALAIFTLRDQVLLLNADVATLKVDVAATESAILPLRDLLTNVAADMRHLREDLATIKTRLDERRTR